MAYEYFHEVEAVELNLPKARRTSTLKPIFKKLGFVLHEDVFSLDRKDHVPPWQHTSVVEVEVLRHGQEVFGFHDGECDLLRLKYLFASLPYQCSERFIDVSFLLQAELDTPLLYHGKEVDRDDLKSRFDECRSELLSMTGEDAGSERLAIMILETYPRH